MGPVSIALVEGLRIVSESIGIKTGAYIVVRFGGRASWSTGEGISYKVVAPDDLVPGAKFAAESGMSIVDAGVDDSNGDSLAKVPFGVELIDAGHDMSRK